MKSAQSQYKPTNVPTPAAIGIVQRMRPDDRSGSFSSNRPASDALGMSASLRSRPNLRTAAIRRSVPGPDVSAGRDAEALLATIDRSVTVVTSRQTTLQ